jgi:splicing factor 1
MLQQRPQQVGRRDIKDAEGAFEDLHVHITADTIEKVEAAVALIEPLLTPVDVSYHVLTEK